MLGLKRARVCVCVAGKGGGRGGAVVCWRRPVRRSFDWPLVQVLGRGILELAHPSSSSCFTRRMEEI